MALDIYYKAPNIEDMNTVADIMEKGQVLKSNKIRNRILEMKLEEGVGDAEIEKAYGEALLNAGMKGNNAAVNVAPDGIVRGEKVVEMAKEGRNENMVMNSPMPSMQKMPYTIGDEGNTTLLPYSPDEPNNYVQLSSGNIEQPKAAAEYSFNPDTMMGEDEQVPIVNSPNEGIMIDPEVARKYPAAYARFFNTQLKNRSEFYAGLMDKAVKAEDDEALQGVIQNMTTDPYLKRTMPKGFGMKVGKGTVQVTSHFDEDQLQKVAEKIEDETLREEVENMPPGIYKVKMKGKKVIAVEAEKEKSMTELELARKLAMKKLTEKGENREPTEEEIAESLTGIKQYNDPVSAAVRHVTGGSKKLYKDLGPDEKGKVDELLGLPSYARQKGTQKAQAEMVDKSDMEQGYQYLKSTGNIRAEDRMMFRAPGAMAEFKKYVADRAKQDGWTGYDRAYAEAARKGLVTEVTTNARMKALTMRYEGMLRRNTDVLEQENIKVLRTRFPSFNAVKQAIERGTGDADILAFQQQLGRVSVEWAKISSGSLGLAEVSVEAQKKMNEILKSSNNWSQLQAQIQTVRVDAGHTTASIYEREKQQREELYRLGGVAAPAESPKTKMVDVKIGSMKINTEMPIESIKAIEKGNRLTEGKGKEKEIEKSTKRIKEGKPASGVGFDFKGVPERKRQEAFKILQDLANRNKAEPTKQEIIDEMKRVRFIVGEGKGKTSGRTVYMLSDGSKMYE